MSVGLGSIWSIGFTASRAMSRTVGSQLAEDASRGMPRPVLRRFRHSCRSRHQDWKVPEDIV